LSGTPVAGHIFLRPRVQLKSIECDALNADRYLGQPRPDLGVEAIAVHAEIAGRIPEPEETGKNLHG
jgi:hypothetical protein